jgi:hypothetical protein
MQRGCRKVGSAMRSSSFGHSTSSYLSRKFLPLPAARIRGITKRSVSSLVLVLAALSCSKQTPQEPAVPPQYVRSIDLSVEDVYVKEAYLRIRFLDSTQPRAFRLYRDGQAVLTVPEAPLDTVVLQDSLAPHQTYSFRAYRLHYALAVDSSMVVSLTTMDSTSHDFTFQSFIWYNRFPGENRLTDVTIVNDTLVYACGSIYVQDSSGLQDPRPYNLMKWNGTSWELMRIRFYTVCGQDSQASYPASSVLAFGPSDVWIAMRGNQLARWNGTYQTATICIPDSFEISKIWAASPNAVYVVGSRGRIGLFANNIWQRLESGTTRPITDIQGARDETSGEDEILCIASDYGEESRILRIRGKTVSEVPPSGVHSWVAAIWHIPGRMYLVGGDSLHYVRRLGNQWKLVSGLPQQVYRISSIQGVALNDIVAGGASLLHSNGSTWRFIVPTPTESYFTRVSLKGNTVVAVGSAYFSPPGSWALAKIGRR